MNERIEAIATQRFPFSAAKVYGSWLTPEAIRIWLRSALMALGLPGELVRVEIDGRIGGKFCFSDNRPMGEVFHWGTYKRLEFPTCLAFTWNAGLHREETDNDSSLVTISIVPNETGCDVRLVHSMDGQWKEFLQRTQDGWKNMLVHIERTMASI